MHSSPEVNSQISKFPVDYSGERYAETKVVIPSRLAHETCFTLIRRELGEYAKSNYYKVDIQLRSFEILNLQILILGTN
jgi:hypothetical protein